MRKTLPLSPSLLTLLTFFLAACNFPTAPTVSLEEQAATVVAKTLTAQAPLETPANVNATPAITRTPTQTKTPTPTITPTYSTPLLKINESTNCRSGPGQSFEILIVFNPGAAVEIVGRYPQDNYWIVKNPEGGLCWIWGEYSTASGSHWTVPSMTPPPQATQSLPEPPGNLTYTFYCTLAGEVTTNLNWSDRAGDEQGYRVYRNGALIATLPSDTTTYSETISANVNDMLTYGVAAFNAAGTSFQPSISFSCQ